MGTVDSLMLGFSVALQPSVLGYAFLGCLVGTIGIDNMTGHFRYAFDIHELEIGRASCRD